MKVYVLRGLVLYEAKGGIIYPVSTTLGAFSFLKAAKAVREEYVTKRTFDKYQIDEITLDEAT